MVDLTEFAALPRILADARPLIGGARIDETASGRMSHVSPITGEVQAHLVVAGAAEVDAAVAAAATAQPQWRAVPGDQRRKLLQRLESLIEQDGRELGRRTILELGLPTTAARHYPLLAAAWFGYYAGWADKIQGSTIPLTPPTGFDYTLVEPYGVVTVIITWNGPLASIGMKVAPALAAGNCVVLKSPELAPFAADRFADLVVEAGFPSGVVNVLPGGPDTGNRLVRHPGVSKVSFTGGGATARRIVEASSQTLVPLALELGGKSANLLFADADLDRAVPNALTWSTVANSGQGCSFPTRLLVERSVYDEVVEGLGKVASSVVVGDPFLPETQMGPVVCQAACERILGAIERAQAEGARLVAGGSRLGGSLAGGFFIPPTVVVDVDPSSDLFRNEVFGPVLAVTPFETEDEAVSLANATPYGLAAYIQSQDSARILRVVPRLSAGTVQVNGKSAMPPNAPFGGYGQSGYGREGGKAGLDEFCQIKNVFIGS